jgi:NADH dehydrogenase
MRRAARLYRRVTPADIRVVLVDVQMRILPELTEQLAAFAAGELARRGVELRMGTRVRGADAEGVDFADGTRTETKTLVWAGGVKPSHLVSRLPFANERGRIPTEPTLAVPGHPNVWAVGDCAEVYPPGGGKPYPPTAQHALREGLAAGKNIFRTLTGKPPQPFAYTMIGQMAELGQHKAVAMIGGLKIRGFPAWWIWRTYYLLRMPTLERKIRVALDWTLDLLFPRDIVKLPLPDKAQR